MKKSPFYPKCHTPPKKKLFIISFLIGRGPEILKFDS